MVPWKVFWVSLGFSLTLVAGGLPILLDVPWFVVTPCVVVLMVAATIVTRQGVEYSDLFHGLTESARSDITGLIVIAIVAHGAWIVTFQLMPQWWMWWPLVLLALSGIEYLAAESYEYVAAAKKRKHGPTGVPSPDSHATDDTSQTMAAAFRGSGLGVVVVDGWEELRDSAHHSG